MLTKVFGQLSDKLVEITLLIRTVLDLLFLDELAHFPHHDLGRSRLLATFLRLGRLLGLGAPGYETLDALLALRQTLIKLS